MRPLPSTIVSPAAGATFPIATMRSPSTRTLPGRGGDPEPSTIRAPVMVVPGPAVRPGSVPAMAAAATRRTAQPE